jgi:hypothetical protein
MDKARSNGRENRMAGSAAHNVRRMKVLFGKFAARRRRKAHERYIQERDWQRMLAEKDTAETIRDAATMWGVAGQATSGPGGEI